MKKLFAMFLTGILVFALAISAGCTYDPYEYEAEEGFFVYKKYKNADHVVIMGLTELGNQQEIIVMPKTIGGYKYNFYYDTAQRPNRYQTINLIANENLKKIYFEYDLLNNKWGAAGQESILYTFHNFAGIKVIVNNITARGASSGSLQNEIDIYTNYKYAYNVDNSPSEKVYDRHFSQLANAQFMYNYDEAPNEGYYWIDDIDDGEKIEIIPPDPEREGYVFSGWYCEPECENEWDFNTEIHKPVLKSGEPYNYKTNEFYIGDKYPEDYVTYVYAKWDKK